MSYKSLKIDGISVQSNSEMSFYNIQNILNIFTDRKDVDYVAKLVPNEKIADENYNLSVSTYVEQEDTREKVDIVKLNVELKEIVEKENILRTEIEKIIAELE